MSPEGSTVTFRRVPAGVRPLALRRFAGRLEREVCAGRGFDCLLAGDAELRRLNREFRDKDYATDVLSFPAPADTSSRRRAGAEGADKKAAGHWRLGDIAISFDRARVQAREFGHETEMEIRILMLHGVLHLLGMDHENEPPGGKGRMARAEARWRDRLGLAPGLIERSAV
jgi:probable rRNA maturation factor